MKRKLEIELVDCPLPTDRVEQLVTVALASGGVHDGHIALTFVSPQRMAEFNERFRGISAPTDVLSFPVDRADPTPGERELGDILICAELCEDLDSVIVHGTLHLIGMDHEIDNGEMLALEQEIVSWIKK